MKPKARWASILGLVILASVCAFLGYQLLAVRGTFAPSLPASEAGGGPVLVGSPGHRIAGRVYLVGPPAVETPLVVVLHGDAPFVNPRYQYLFASQVAHAAPGSWVVGLLRPGYADPFGARSDGNRGFASGENYTLEVVNDIAAAIWDLQSQWHASSIILVGHSGGAAIAADIAALNPGLVQQVFLVGCPCDVPAFRRHMAQLQWGPLWLLPVHSLSPLQTLDQMQKGTVITAISGSQDPIALPQYARAYVAKAISLGLSASMLTLPNQGHEILNDPEVVNAVAEAARNHK